MKYLNKHMNQTGKLAKSFGEYLRLEDDKLQDLFVAGILHDIGKTKINKDILNKTTKLTDEDFEEIKKHPVYSREILSGKKYNERIIEGVAQHHERIDGKGYPEGIKGNGISLIGRILAVCDSYEAMVGKRIYRKVKSKEEALEEIEKNLDTQFDKEIGFNFINFAEKNL